MNVAFRTLGVIAVLLGLLLAFLPGGAELRDTRDIDTTPDLVGGNVPFRITALVTGVVVGVGLWWLGSEATTGRHHRRRSRSSRAPAGSINGRPVGPRRVLLRSSHLPDRHA